MAPGAPSHRPIEDHAVIGDLNTAALVALDGSIDFLCFPRFDSPSVFAALLDENRGGRFSVAPSLDDARHRQIYLPDTNVLLTRFLSPEGVAEILDFMPVVADGGGGQIIRRVKTIRGEVHFRLGCEPRFDYARAGHRVERDGTGVVMLSTGADGTALRLQADIPLEVHGGDVRGEFLLRAGESADIVLQDARAPAMPAAMSERISGLLDETVAFWRRWVARGSYRGRWRETVTRSALTLKLLFSEPHGSLIAAATFGLPEEIGGVRNWDYRYVWVRDAAFTLRTLSLLGHQQEAMRFMEWIEERAREEAADAWQNGPLQPMYRIDGRQRLDESELEHLSGYRDSRPVRIGNAAYDQLQLDIYGELLDAVYLFNRLDAPIAYDLWRDLALIVDWVAENWRRPDRGIWEMRGGEREFLHSRLMCWVALDRAVRLARSRSFPGNVDRWISERDHIYLDIYERFWDPAQGAFVQYAGTAALDAASLMMPMVKFLSFREPRWISHLAAVERQLAWDSLVYRYQIVPDSPDGLRGGEGTFSICSFWYIENLARAGDVDRARFYFEKMAAYANHVGLYSEELGPTGEHLGNFPQAFTHLGLISAAVAIERALEAGAGRPAL